MNKVVAACQLGVLPSVSSVPSVVGQSELGSLQKVTIDRVLRLIDALGLEAEIRVRRSSYCIGHLFDLTGANRVTGITTVALSNDCAAIDGGPFAMTSGCEGTHLVS